MFIEHLCHTCESINLKDPIIAAQVEETAAKLYKIESGTFRHIKERVEKFVRQEKVEQRLGEQAAREMSQKWIENGCEEEMDYLAKELAINEAVVLLLDTILHALRQDPALLRNLDPKRPLCH